MKKYIIIILIINLLAPCACLAQNLTWNTDYLIDGAKTFEDNLLDKKDIIKDLKKINQNENLSLKILTLNLPNDKDIANYCQQDPTDKKNSQIILVYNQKNNKLRYCNLSKNSIDITNDELDYIINGIAQPNIDNNHLTFALRIAIKKIEGATVADIAPKNDYQAEIKKEETWKKIIVFLFIAILFSWLAAFLGRTKSWWLGGIIGFGLGIFIWRISEIWFFMPLFLISGLTYDYFVSRRYKEYGSCEKGKFWCSIKDLKKTKKK
ncbi:MAG: hypothetical protein ABIC82_05595 [bacterium]